ncbi:MAG: hypothetical protein WKG00_25575 [Polyangiaceae bacterium]
MPLFAILAATVAACGSEQVGEQGEEESVGESELAATSREYETTFFSNASKTVVVGTRWYTCYGPVETDGQVTQYRTTVWGDSCGSGGSTGGNYCCAYQGSCPSACNWCIQC